MPSLLDFPVSKVTDPLRIAGKGFRVGEKSHFLKMVSFGPFQVGAFPDEGIGEISRIRDDLGANALRLYTLPSLEFLHVCAEEGMRVFLTLPWEQDVDFLRDRLPLLRAEALLTETIRRFRGHPAVAGYYVGNEIESTLVRWMGPRRVCEALEQLIDVGHTEDPGVLFSYANKPATEYLLPCNQDFVAFNLRIDMPESLAEYLPRLQNVAGNKPLVVSEFRVDAHLHGEDGQANLLAGHLEELQRAGVAGTTIFSWSDLIKTTESGSSEVAWGLTRGDRSPKPSVDLVREAWSETRREAALSSSAPTMGVIVCTYRGSGTLVACLDTLVRQNYPNFEVVVVNDGADARVSEIVATYDAVREIPTDHIGLSAARNLGAAETSGEILVYTDDDCEADPDWLLWLARGFAGHPGRACVGGPNIPPPPENWREAALAVAPGGASHVLLDDVRAECLPGCNLAVRREAFDRVGGFDIRFRTAGDDVDFCWRIGQAGYELAFQAPAFVWHRRRSTARAYFRQQVGYGRAEALMISLYEPRFRSFGGPQWRGRIYTPQLLASQQIEHGRLGKAEVQPMKPSAETGLGDLLLHVLWWMGALAAAWGALWFPPLGFLALLMILGAIRVAVIKAGRCILSGAHDTTLARLYLVGLMLGQGVVRSSARLGAGWKSLAWSRAARSFGKQAAGAVTASWWKLGGEVAFTNHRGEDRERLLDTILKSEPDAEIDESGKTDLILRSGWFWNWALITATEVKSGKDRLVRVRLLARPQPWLRLVVLPMIFLLPVALWLGLGFQSEFFSALVIYVALAAAAKLWMSWRVRTLIPVGESLGWDRAKDHENLVAGR
jgi:O-antigen biosynthesis protein